MVAYASRYGESPDGLGKLNLHWKGTEELGAGEDQPQEFSTHGNRSPYLVVGPELRNFH